MKLVFVRSHDLLLWFHETVLQSACTENKPAARRSTCPVGEAYLRAALEDNRALLVRDVARSRESLLRAPRAAKPPPHHREA
jgi:hypothetical protein